MAALGEGRKDAAFFVLGGLGGAFLYMITYSKFKGTMLLEEVFGGKVTLAATPNESFGAILTGIPGLAVALAVAGMFCLVAWKLPDNSR